MSHRLLKRAAVPALIALLTACGVEGAIAPSTVAPNRVTATPATRVVIATAALPSPQTLLPTAAPTASATAAPTVSPIAAEPIGETSNLGQLALSPRNAPPMPAAGVPAPATASEPVRIMIPDINLDLETLAVGLDPQQVPIVPKHEPGWFTSSAVPGQGTNIVFWGHVLRWQDSPAVAAPFARIEELKPGAAIEVRSADGKAWSYRVTQQLRARPEDVHFLYPTLTERVTLVSCIGDKVIQDGTLTKEFRLVTVAEPIR